MTASPPSASRRTVTVLFCDVVDSTPLGERLDAETLRRVQTEYFAAVRGVLERHGGLVEKFIGDAAMAVFGLPTLHEDDALRAARAASELGAAVLPIDRELDRDHGLRLRIRVGVATGEVVTGDPAGGQALATGETVVTAQRLEQAARPEEVLVDDPTYRLIADAVDAEPVEAVAAKGKTEPVAAWRLLGVETGALGVARRFDTPLVGRESELAALRGALERALAGRRCQLVTVVGQAGVGKSRLVREFLLEAGPAATVRIGRCPPYGDGITFLPVAEVLPDETLEGTTDEIFRRVRKSFEQLAERGPLVLCFDDVHWAEPTFLNLVDYLKGWIVAAPVLIVCLARPELLDERPEWQQSSLSLPPLSPAEIETLLDALDAPAEARGRIAEAAEGNPLFAEQVAAIAVDEGSEFVVPRSIQLLLAARLDRLAASERSVAEWAAVVGREFPLRAVAALAPEEMRAEVAGHLFALLRKDLVEPHAGLFWEEDGFRFRHGLIRDVAYEGIPKEVRAELHERYARWYDRYHGEDVIVGYHLEQAFRYRQQLGRVDESLGEEAGRCLAVAGRRAFARQDTPAATKLLQRALALLPKDDPERRELMREESIALWLGGEARKSTAVLDELLELAVESGDRRMEWYALLERAHRRTMIDPGATADELLAVTEQAIAVFEELGDESGLAQAWRRRSLAPRGQGDFATAEEALERAYVHARKATDRQEQGRTIDALCGILLYGPAPVDAALRRCDELLEAAGGDLLAEACVLRTTAALRAMRGEFGLSRSLCAGVRETYQDLGLRLALVALAEIAGGIELLAGNAAEAEVALRGGYEILFAMGDATVVAFQAGLLAETVALQGRLEEAEELVRRAEEGAAEDIGAQIHWRATKAAIESLRGRHDAAIELARKAVEIAAGTDALNMHAGAALRLAEVLRRAGRLEEAARSASDAVRLYEHKGNVVAARAALPSVAV
ncbi:MAG: adenylate/guanylate cyclase domain-containing protein [Gaiellaceae bacterium]